MTKSKAKTRTKAVKAQMTKTLSVTLRIEVEDLTEEERQQQGAFDDTECESEYLKDIDDALFVADVLTGIPIASEIFAGTGVFVKFTEAKVMHAEWIAPSPRKGKRK